MNITVVGLGYVGLANAICLAQRNKVIAVELCEEKVQLVNERKSPIDDPEIIDYLANYPLDLTATTEYIEAYKSSDYVLVTTPTDYDPESDYFDTSSVESVIKDITHINPNALIIIKSTIPIGFVNQIKQNTGNKNILFSPEFLREGKALYDNLYPSRIIVGEKSERAREFANLLVQGASIKNPPVLLMGSTEAEAVKLFANTYLAMRVGFFNELDTFALASSLDSEDIIKGISHDPRIGSFYNNPSFGYGGYCLPKDTKQLLANFKGIPQSLIGAIVSSNRLRQDFIAKRIMETEPNSVGIYRLSMKSGSDNYRSSAIFEVIERLREAGAEVFIYEPLLQDEVFMHCKVIKDIEEFKLVSNIIVCNRKDDELRAVESKIFSRDIFSTD